MKFIQRIKNLWCWSGISLEEFKENPQAASIKYFNGQEMQGKAYIVGLSEEEQSFKDSLNVDNKDTLIA